MQPELRAAADSYLTPDDFLQAGFHEFGLMWRRNFNSGSAESVSVTVEPTGATVLRVRVLDAWACGITAFIPLAPVKTKADLSRLIGTFVTD